MPPDGRRFFHIETDGLLVRQAFADSELYLSVVCIWAKQATFPGSSPYQWKHEPVLFGWKQNGKHKWYSDRKQSTIWRFDRTAKTTEHLEMLPIALCAYPMRGSTMTGAIVLDLFAKVGSTLIAAEQIGRVCFAVESDPRYCDVTVQRYITLNDSAAGVFLLRDGKQHEYAFKG